LHKLPGVAQKRAKLLARRRREEAGDDRPKDVRFGRRRKQRRRGQPQIFLLRGIHIAVDQTTTSERGVRSEHERGERDVQMSTKKRKNVRHREELSGQRRPYRLR
jgi:hypothetical protein